jgi:hypothetical protein
MGSAAVSLPAVRLVTQWDEDELAEAALPAMRRFLAGRRLSRASKGRLLAWFLAYRGAEKADHVGGEPLEAVICDRDGWVVVANLGNGSPGLEALSFDEFLAAHEDWIWDNTNGFAVQGGLG